MSEFSGVMSTVDPSSLSIVAIIAVVLALILALFLYFLPSFIAFKRHHIQKVGILILNIFLGWSFIGWVIALIWSTLKDKSANTNQIR